MKNLKKEAYSTAEKIKTAKSVTVKTIDFSPEGCCEACNEELSENKASGWENWYIKEQKKNKNKQGV